MTAMVRVAAWGLADARMTGSGTIGRSCALRGKALTVGSCRGDRPHSSQLASRDAPPESGSLFMFMIPPEAVPIDTGVGSFRAARLALCTSSRGEMRPSMNIEGVGSLLFKSPQGRRRPRDCPIERRPFNACFLADFAQLFEAGEVSLTANYELI